MTRTRLSVITATYNDRPYIEEAVTSILNQTYNDFEYIIVDDASTDGTRELLESIKDKRVTVLRNEVKEGSGSARNRGLSMAKGEYVAIMDGDDISHPLRFETQIRYMDANPSIAYLGTGVSKIGKYDGRFILSDIRPLTDGAIRWMLLARSPIVHASSIGRKGIITKVGGYDINLLRSQDVDLIRKISEVGQLANIPDILYTYRVRSGENLDKVVNFALPYARLVHTTYINDLLDNRYDRNIINYIWSMRYPIHDNLPNENVETFLYKAVATLFALYTVFQFKYELSQTEMTFIQEDLIRWITRIASKSSRYSYLIDRFLASENLENMRPTSSLLKAWVKSIL